MAGKTKSFTDSSPLFGLISAQEEQPAAAEELEVEERPAQTAPVEAIAAAPAGSYINPEFIEKRSQHVQTLLAPSIVKGLDKLAKKRKTSRNDIINIALREYIEKNTK